MGAASSSHPGCLQGIGGPGTAGTAKQSPLFEGWGSSAALHCLSSCFEFTQAVHPHRGAARGQEVHLPLRLLHPHLEPLYRMCI